VKCERHLDRQQRAARSRYRGPRWANWSQHQLESWSIKGRLFINGVVYAEASVGFTRIEGWDALLATMPIELVEAPRPALFLAGKVFQQYRRSGGRRAGVLPDFFIGAHAAVARLPLLTRDTRRYRTYFPQLELVAP
jgi:predicted nucleic acid-binding protein